MSLIWALSFILLLVIILFVVFPNVMSSPTTVQTSIVHLPPSTTIHGPGTGAGTGTECSPESRDERCLDREMLKAYYPPPLTDKVPIDYPRKAIGACPDAKPQSRSLPFADMPMYMM